MLERVLLAALASTSLIGAAARSCVGSAPPPALLSPDGGEAREAVACPSISETDAVAVRVLLTEASRLLVDTPEASLLPSGVIPGRVCSDASETLHFEAGPPPEHLDAVYLTTPDEGFGNPPVWYDDSVGRIFYCLACAKEQPFSSGMLGLLYARALFDRATLPFVQDDASALQQEMNGALLMLGAVNRASGGKFIPRLANVLKKESGLSAPVFNDSPWFIPNDKGWDLVEPVWPWQTQSEDEGELMDDVVHLSCAFLQGKTQKQLQEAFLLIQDYTAQGC